MECILEHELLQIYAFYAAVLVIKILYMAPLTSNQRHAKNIFSNPEDASYFDNKQCEPKVKFDDFDGVERVRRAHRNDLENIPAFLFISALYMLTKPRPILYSVLLLSYTIARIGHSYVYAVKVVPQPARLYTWAWGYLLTAYMAGHVIISSLFF